MKGRNFKDIQDTVSHWMHGQGLDRSRMHATLVQSMAVYRHLPGKYQQVICDFVLRFYRHKTVFAHPAVKHRDTLLAITASNAALVGAAQQTNCFASVQWIYFCAKDLPVEGDAQNTTTVRLRAKTCLKESRVITPGSNLVVHEFAHILDALLGISGSTAALRDGFDQYMGNLASADDVIADCFTPLEDTPHGIEFTEDADLHTEVEFFAVATEAFFTHPYRLKESYPALYRDFVSIYGLDMADYLG